MEESTFVEKYHNVCGHLTLEKLKDFLTDVARASGKEQLYADAEEHAAALRAEGLDTWSDLFETELDDLCAMLPGAAPLPPATGRPSAAAAGGQLV